MRFAKGKFGAAAEKNQNVYIYTICECEKHQCRVATGILTRAELRNRIREYKAMGVQVKTRVRSELAMHTGQPTQIIEIRLKMGCI